MRRRKRMPTDLTLTRFERLALINQLVIRKAVDKGDAASCDRAIEILEKGYELFYSEIAGHLCDPLPDATARFVLDVLDMYSAIARSASFWMSLWRWGRRDCTIRPTLQSPRRITA